MPLKRPYRGVFPVVPTTFTENGDLDIPSQVRCIDFMIDAPSMAPDTGMPPIPLTEEEARDVAAYLYTLHE
jgi:dihydrodipicolinate synthase/N-acetylneuraminate lyase